MIKRLWLALFFVLLSTVPALAGPLTITVNERSVIQGPLITLGEIAAITGDDTSRITQISNLKLGAAPTPGGSVTLTQELLGMRLSGTGIDLSGITWQVPPQMTVITGSQAVSGATLLEAAQAALAKKMSAASGEISITAITNPTDILAPVGSLTYGVEIPGGIRLNMPTVAYVIISVDGRRYSSIPVKIDMRLFQNLIVTARPVGAKEVLNADSIRLERRDVGRLPPGYITDVNKVLGLMSRRQLSAGTVLTEAMLDKPAVVRRGSPVTIVAKIGDIEVTAAGQALQDGAQDQLIRVQNSNSKKFITAKVLDGSSVLALTYNGK